MKQETRQKLLVFFTENIEKSLEKFDKSNPPAIGMKAHCYADRRDVVGGFHGMRVEFVDDIGPWKDSKLVFPDDDFTQQSHKEVGEVFREAVNSISTDYNKTFMRGKHEYPVHLKDKRYPYWTTISYDYCKGVSYENHPCKEFNELNDYLYGRFHKRLGMHDLYKVRLFGKRGQYDESGDKSYLCHRPLACKNMKFTLEHETKGNSLGFATDDDIDTDYSRRYETECYGCRTRTITVDGRIAFYW